MSFFLILKEKTKENQRRGISSEKYAKDLITHHNSYTGLKYNEDPVIALVEITNENSITGFWKKGYLKMEGLRGATQSRSN